MWIAEQGRRRPQADGTALVGQVTLPGDPAAVYLDGERRELPVYGPGGYVWRPAKDQQVLVLKTGAAGEAPCVAGAPAGRTGISPPARCSSIAARPRSGWGAAASPSAAAWST